MSPMPRARATMPTASRTKAASPVSRAAETYSACRSGVSRYSATSKRVVLTIAIARPTYFDHGPYVAYGLHIREQHPKVIQRADARCAGSPITLAPLRSAIASLLERKDARCRG